MQVGDGLQRQAAGGIELGVDPLVAGDGGIDVTDGIGNELRLAQRDARLVRRRLRRPLEALQERGRGFAEFKDEANCVVEELIVIAFH